jgi:aryl-alcohol dehydrogenase-like predicted oxidoreductase
MAIGLNEAGRLALGTVQFGLPYGIANHGGQVNSAEGGGIVRRAWAAGIDTLDTAIAYGDAESRLGAIGIDQWKVVSKLPQIPDTVDAANWVRRQIEESLARLKVQSLYGLLLHQPASLLGPQGNAIYAAMVDAKNSGLVEKIGISAYEPEDIDAITSRFNLDLVQAPLSIIDRRLITSGCLERMHQAGIEFHARSIFLQGLLLMDPPQRPASFARWSGLWDAWCGWLQEVRLTPLQACLGFVAAQESVARFVVGVESCVQLEQILSAIDEAEGMAFPEELASQDPQLINPSNWTGH